MSAFSVHLESFSTWRLGKLLITTLPHSDVLYGLLGSILPSFVALIRRDFENIFRGDVRPKVRRPTVHWPTKVILDHGIEKLKPGNPN